MNNVRRIDDLGRVVIPKEIRRELGWSAGEALDINVLSSTQIIISKCISK
jgi:AbrB family looped-hinge helix DNA binding protein